MQLPHQLAIKMAGGGKVRLEGPQVCFEEAYVWDRDHQQVEKLIHVRGESLISSNVSFSSCVCCPHRCPRETSRGVVLFSIPSKSPKRSWGGRECAGRGTTSSTCDFPWLASLSAIDPGELIPSIRMPTPLCNFYADRGNAAFVFMFCLALHCTRYLHLNATSGPKPMPSTYNLISANLFHSRIPPRENTNKIIL
jgi:hypothetical protein